MTTLRILGIFLVMTACAVLLLPLTTLGVVYTVITTCILLSLLPLSVETLMTLEIRGGNK